MCFAFARHRQLGDGRGEFLNHLLTALRYNIVSVVKDARQREVATLQ